MANPRPVKVIAITSGKGGVGKTNVSVNLAAALSARNQRVMLMDADLGLANVDVMLGLSPRKNLSHVIDGTATLDEVLLRAPGDFTIVPASSGTQRMAELTPAEHAGLIRSFSELSHDLDYLLVDTAAGISDGVMSFAKASREVMVVVCDEPSSITDAYALIKVLNRDHGVERFHMVANRVRSPEEGRMLFRKLSAATDRFLDLAIDYVGMVPEDDCLRRAVQKQQPVVTSFPGSPAARAFKDMAMRVQKWPMPAQMVGNLEFFVERLVQYSAGEVS
ncbi:flagellar biosynthesis protein FlhG [Alkalispirillum mobile]|uniref:Flagellar biosynthesis protein FlhG n=1 Tax=Alkalispirillum mobile TaxID=85925 RepID=A0A498BZ79_9GAMM|nr:MinD/ParA family protein [Alkalispirillum mobile]RLK48742.1 flagellar biosynthesis protein FlhG [Alkalispirillum mobile]